MFIIIYYRQNEGTDSTFRKHYFLKAYPKLSAKAKQVHLLLSLAFPGRKRKYVIEYKENKKNKKIRKNMHCSWLMRTFVG